MHRIYIDSSAVWYNAGKLGSYRIHTIPTSFSGGGYNVCLYTCVVVYNNSNRFSLFK